MSIDLEQFHAVFFEESQEHIDTMEQLLMSLDIQQPDSEELNSIFRAAHSIKGGSGTFGFTALTQVTHVMENLLDQLRQGQRQLSGELVDHFLQVLDGLRLLLTQYRAGSAIDDDLVAQLTGDLEVLLAQEAVPDAPPAKAEVTVEDDEAFGFFDPLPEPEAATEPPQQESWGLFDEAPEPAEKAVPETPRAAENKPRPSGADSTAKVATNVEAATIRVDVDKVDALINLVGELVITQSMLKVLGETPDSLDVMKMVSVLNELERNTREIQESVMSIRMIPVSVIFNRFPRVVRDLAGKMEKNVELILSGTQTELDKRLIEKLGDPLTHLVRNSIDHGIERTEIRREAGKPEKGCITISAAQRGGSIMISISDDGAGLNREKIMAKARENGLDISDDAPDAQVWDLIFQPGFSTADLVTDVSGRGVGMDVVRRNIQQLGGRIEISSLPGHGSTFTIQLPLTLAIVDGMGVSVGGQTFIIPLVSIIESMQPKKSHIKFLAGSTLLHVREEYWPLLPLHEVMDVPPIYPDPTDGIVVLIESNKRRYGLVVDELVGQQQVVIKSLEQHYRRVPGTAGATIMGDGSVALILDVESLAEIVRTPVEESA